MRLFKTSRLSGWEMGVTEEGLRQSVGPNVISAREGADAEPIGERWCWHSETQERQRGAVAPNERYRGDLAIGKALSSVGGSHPSLPPSFRGAK